MEAYTDLFGTGVALAEESMPNEHARLFLNGLKEGLLTLLLVYPKTDEHWFLKLWPFSKAEKLPFYAYEEESAIMIYTPIPPKILTEEHKEQFRDFVYQTGILSQGKVIPIK